MIESMLLLVIHVVLYLLLWACWLYWAHQHWLHTNLEAGSGKHNITDPFAVKFDIETPLLNRSIGSH